MRTRKYLCIAFMLLASSLWGQVPQENPPSEVDLADVTTRGRALAEYDSAAWHSSDAVLALKPAEGSVRLYVARKTEKGWAVAYGRFDEARTRLLIAYEAKQSNASDEYTVTKHDPPEEDTDFYFRAARALDLAKAEFLRDVNPQRQYNFSVLPGPSGGWLCYALPAQTDASVLPYGGDVRYRVSPDGTQIVETRRMHETVLEEKIGGNQQAFGFHTHVRSDVPEDSDVFYALARKATQGDWIATKKYFYQVRPDGTIVSLGKTSEIAILVEDDKFEALPATYKPMMLVSLRRLLEGTSSAQPLEAFPTFLGARCADHTIWLRFSTIVHNVGDSRVILYKDAFQNSQARFAATGEDIEAGKYEKLAFFTYVRPDYSAKDAFFMLGPSMSHSLEREYPILGLDLKGKGAVQFVFFTWPLAEEKEIDSQRARWRDAGVLYTDAVVTAPVPMNVDPNLLKSCAPK